MFARLVVLLLAMLGTGVSAQRAPEVVLGDGCTLYAVDGEAVAGPYRPPRVLLRGDLPETRVVTQSSSTFDVTYVGFTAPAQAAFQRAVDIWAAHLTSPVPIRVRAQFAPLDAGTLGSAGPFLLRDFGSGQGATWYPFALADALAGRDIVAGTASDTVDVVAQFSSSRNDFYFGLDGNPGPAQFDFVTIVLHELGHGLGFIGSGNVDNGSGDAECSGTRNAGCWGYFSGSFSGFPYIFDRLITDGQGIAFLNQTAYPNPSLPLGTLLRSQDLFASSPEVTRIYQSPAPLWAPVAFDAGSSFSHWDEVVVRGTSAALMTPRVTQGEAYQDPGNITCAFLKDMGWSLGAGCQLLTTDGEAGPDAALSLAVDGPNPVRTRTTVRLRQSRPGAVAVELFDTLGRRLATVFEGPAGRDTRFPIETGALAPGTYLVVARAAGAVRTIPLTVVR